jgi:hypothetical protein
MNLATASAPGVVAGAFTLGFWWKPGANITEMFLPGVRGTGSSTTGWQLQNWDGNYILQVATGGSFNTYEIAESSVGISASGPAQYYWVTYDGSSAWNCYINGSSTAVITGSGALVPATGTPYYTVTGYLGAATYGGTGFFQDILTWGSVLSASTRQAIYTAATT